MSDRAYAKVPAQQKTLRGPSPKSNLLRRTCVCGGLPGIDGLCTECRDKRLTWQSSRGGFEVPSVSAAVQGTSPAQENVTSLSTAVDKASHFGHDFSRIPVYSSHLPVLQTKLAVNQSGDIYQQKADQVTEQVTRVTDGESSAPDEEDEAKDSLMRKRASEPGAHTAPPIPPIVHAVLNGGERQPLDTTTRAFMEPRFGHDFSKVRVHTDAKAAESARALNALAYTVGQDVVFNTDQYTPGTTEGKKLLAHELTHVVQQRNEAATIGTTLRIGDPKDSSEAEAEAVSHAAVEQFPTGGSVPTLPGSAYRQQGLGTSLLRTEVHVQRQRPKSIAGTQQPKSSSSTVVDPASRITGYLGRQVVNWATGAREGCDDFRVFVKDNPENEKKVWLTVAKDVAVFFGKMALKGVISETTLGLGEIGISAMEEYLKGQVAEGEAAKVDDVFNSFKNSIDNAQSAMTNEELLQKWADTALTYPDIVKAIKEENVPYWTSRVRSIAQVPNGDDITTVRNNTLTELLKLYFAENVTEVGLEFAPYQPLPYGINIALKNWPAIAKRIKQGDPRWHVYKDKTIVAEVGGERHVIPLDALDDPEIADIMSKLEYQALQDVKLPELPRGTK